MTRADIYETILYYTRRAEEAAETLQSKKSQIANEFHTERIKDSKKKFPNLRFKYIFDIKIVF